ncbi:Winged helix-turn-helix transcription repressor DNA-binding [Penicillium concentricum]|uniref:Winged helix-turn-helix transcription repressor DNA-binding n=1 Tax=Penicillium concentricum TaxID=293559 RepID=A0A9W9VK79_9EURO|nr:Winged helix-turn-helix transcription repressor DNA-binding [Penicillium concentricum]KAJ5382510.1 Winged helix-turn-helix transcription repressor DNA-binding [Penicillium concentricum]
MLPSHLVSAINEARDIINDPSTKKEDVAQLRQACASLNKVLEDPADRLLNQAFQIQDLVIARMAIQLGVFDGPEPIFGPCDVADQSGCDPALASRVLRALVGLGLLDITKEGKYELNESSKSLKKGAMVQDGIIMTLDVALKMSANTLSFFESNGYHNPTNANRGIFQHTFGTSLPFFEWLPSQPLLQDAFNRFMEATAGDGTPAQWAQWFPMEFKFQELYEKSQKDKKSLTFVDVGGGHGHEAKAVMSRFSHIPCRFVVQDGPEYVKSHGAELETGTHRSLERMEYSFFNKQPVEHAHVYFLGRVLHNWPEVQSRQILENIRAAMDQDSVLLIHDWVLSDNPADLSPEQARDDWAMMTLFSAPERSASGWRALLDSAQLKLVNIWASPNNNGGRNTTLLEAVVKT